MESSRAGTLHFNFFLPELGELEGGDQLNAKPTEEPSLLLQTEDTEGPSGMAEMMFKCRYSFWWAEVIIFLHTLSCPICASVSHYWPTEVYHFGVQC